MKRGVISLVLAMVVGFILNGCAASTAMSNKNTTKKSRIIFDVSDKYDVEKIKSALTNAVSERVPNLRENENFFPDSLPEKPSKPVYKNMFGGLGAMAKGNPQFEMMSLNTSNAYYTISGNGGMDSGFNRKIEVYKGAIYPYKKGYRIYLYLFYEEGTDGLMGTLTKTMVDSIVGEDGALLYMAQVRDAFLKEIPDATIISQSPRKLTKLNLNTIGFKKSN